MALFASSSTKKLPLFPRGLAIVILAATALAPAPQAEGQKERSAKPRVYNLIYKEGEPIDQLIRERLGRRYDVIELRNHQTYVEAKLTKTRFPNPIFDRDNVEVSGSVRVCFVITTDGRLVDPFIYGTANSLLHGPVLNVLNEFRAIPAKLNGAPIATVEALKFTFGDGPRRRLDTN